MEKADRKNLKKVLVVVRHAHRTQGGVDSDNGLSKKGQKQAEQIYKYYRASFGKRKPVIFTSPKKRCVETIQKIAKKFSIEPIQSDILDEGGDLGKKAILFMSQWSKSRDLFTLICSHGDFIPLLLEKMIGARIQLDKGGLAEIEMNQERPDLRYIIQNFDFIYKYQ